MLELAFAGFCSACLWLTVRTLYVPTTELALAESAGSWGRDASWFWAES